MFRLRLKCLIHYVINPILVLPFINNLFHHHIDLTWLPHPSLCLQSSIDFLGIHLLQCSQVMNASKHLTPYVMSLHPLQRKLIFMWFKNNYMFCLMCFKHLDLSHWHCPFEGWRIKLFKHCHCWSHICKSLTHTSFAFSFATWKVAQT